MKFEIIKDKNFFPFLDEFKSKEMETNYRQWVFEDDLLLMRGVVAITITASILFLLLDILFLTNQAINVFFITHLLVISICIFIFFALGRTKDYRRLDHFVFMLLMFVILMIFISNTHRPINYVAHSGIDVAIIFLCYVANSASLKYRLGINLIFSVGLLVILYTIKEPNYNFTYMSYTSSVVIANIFGYILSILLGRTRRNNYQLLLREKKLHEEIKTLEGIIPICGYCKSIRDDEGSWEQLEAYIDSHSNAQFSHGICPTCYEEQRP